jgi:hypothetical protein
VRLGITQQKDNGIRLNANAGKEDKDLTENLAFFGQNIQDHLNACCNSLMGHKPAYSDKSIFYDKLSMESVAQLSDLANRLGMQALQQMNRSAMQLQTDNAGHKGGDFRMTFDVFNFNDAQKSIAAKNNSSVRA